MKKRVVQLCAFHSKYTDDLMDRLLKNRRFTDEFELTSIYIFDVEDTYRKEHPFISKRSNILEKVIYRLFFCFYIIQKFKFDRKKDIVNIQFVSAELAFLAPFFLLNFKTIVLTFWGSDLLRTTTKDKKRQKVLFKIASFITFETKSMAKIFKDIFGEKYNDKIRYVNLGSAILDHIETVTSESIEVFAKQYKIDRKKTIVAIGYNAIKAQQHIPAISSIINAGFSKEEIFLVIPWTYGINETSGQYKNDIIKVIGDRFEYCFLETRLSDTEMAAFRKLTDVLIHVQTTDCLSGSMLETLYAKKMVIAGEWLPYDDIFQMGIKMSKVNSIDDVGRALNDLLKGPLSTDELEKNSDIIEKMIKWKYSIEKWIDLYKQC